MSDISLPPPISAASLFSSRFSNKINQTQGKLRFANLRENELDNYVLAGGLDRGVVIGLSAQTIDGAGWGQEANVGRVLSMSLIVTTLLGDSTARVLVVDTLGSFPVVLLERMVRATLREQREREKLARSPRVKHEDIALDDEFVERCLARVDISRVFSVEGLWEVLREMKDFPLDEDEGEVDEQEGTDTTDKEAPAEDNDSQAEDDAEMLNPAEVEIEDSEADESDLELASSPPWPVSQPPDALEVNHGTAGSDKTPEERPSKIELILVDNMTTLINELFSRVERKAAHQTLTTLTLTLRSIASTQNLSVVLQNTVISTARPNTTARTYHSSSVFAGTNVRPSLGLIFDDMIQLHVMATKVPRSREDAEMLYGEDGDSEEDQSNGYRASRRKQLSLSYCTIFEVLKDTCPFYSSSNRGTDDPSQSWAQLQYEKSSGLLKRRDQRWCALDVVYDSSGIVLGVKDAFKGVQNMKAMGQVRRGLGQAGSNAMMDVGSIAKIYGFGGRRV